MFKKRTRRPKGTPILPGVLFLLVFTPLAFGAVHPWAFSLMEGVIFFLMLLWAIRLFRTGTNSQRGGEGGPKPAPFLVPLGLFILFVLFQLLPLPPSVIQVISPSTYEIYSRSLPGWPDSPPYERLLGAHTLADTQLEESGGVGEGERGRSNTERPTRNTGEWLPLSLAPALTKTDLLKFTAYTVLFFLILCCPLPANLAERKRGGEGRTEDRTPHTSHRIRDLGHSRPWQRGGEGESGRRGDRTPAPEDLTPEQRFARKILFTVMICGFVVAVLGFMNLFTWNGRILWLFQPYDEGAGAGAVRASAPFISPDTFANYLALIFPLFVGATFFRSFLSIRRFGGSFRILYGFGTFILLCSLLLSLSRAGWAATAVGVGVLLFLAAGIAKKPRAVFGGKYAPTLKRLTVGAVSAGFVAALLYVGPQGRQSLDVRLTETLEQRVDFFGRATIWRDAAGMLRDFPVLGVGLGAWPELFPRYQKPRLGIGFYREAHNDYLEVLSETGIIGFSLLAWFFWVCFSRILWGLKSQREGEWESGRRGDPAAHPMDRFNIPVVAALMAGMGGLAFHEIFDFNLQIPANALLFTVFLALSLRLTAGSQRGGEGVRGRAGDRRPNARRVVAVLMGLGALVLLREAFTQEMLPYPHNLTLNPPETMAQAVHRIRNYPAQSDAHLYVFQLLSSPTISEETQPPRPNTEVGESRTNADDRTPDTELVVPRSPTRAKSQAADPAVGSRRSEVGRTSFQKTYTVPGAQGTQSQVTGQGPPTPGESPNTQDPTPNTQLLSELEIALWLEPKNTRARDVYAALLIRQGKLREGLLEVTRSVRDAPSMKDHFYLTREFVSRLSPLEQDAIEKGFKEAMETGDKGIMDQLGQFYATTGRLGQRAAFFEDAAAETTDPELKEKYLLEAAYTSAKSEDFAAAEDLFYKVLLVKPDNTRVYKELINRVYKPRQDLDAVREVVVEGIARGANAFTLYLALADVSRAAGDPDTARAAVREASKLMRDSTENGSGLYEKYITVVNAARRAGDPKLAKALLEDAAKLAPSTYEELYRLAILYAQLGNTDRAAHYFRRATQVNPGSASAFYQLALIEERNFRFHVADSAYANAVRLAPDNKAIRERYDRFKKRVRDAKPEDGDR